LGRIDRWSFGLRLDGIILALLLANQRHFGWKMELCVEPKDSTIEGRLTAEEKKKAIGG
jgi:hypothetical protein